MKTIGRILKNGEIEHEYFCQGFIYKNFERFDTKSKKICYAGEYDENEKDGYSYYDFLRIANEFINKNKDVKKYLKSEYGNGTSIHDIARNLFDMVDWQSPETLVDQWEINGSYTE